MSREHVREQKRSGIRPSEKTRLTVVMLVCMGVAGFVLFRAAYIQLLKNPRLETMARRQFQARTLIRPRRGPILDRHGEPLAVNLEANSLAANPNKIKNKRKLARLLARSTDVSYEKILQKIRDDREFVWIKRHLSEGEIRSFKKWRIMDSDGDLVDGLWLVKESERAYPHGQLAAHLIGTVNIDAEGLEGVELWANSRLRGKVASVTSIKDALGRPTFIDADAAQSVQDGEPITLTIDASLQFEVEQALKSAVHRTNSHGGSVIVMDAGTGEILALANEPTFNPNDKIVLNERRRNRALTDGYEPGSTFKAILLASALMNGWKASDQIWGENGSFVVQNHKISEAEAKEKFGWTSLQKMIQVSSNVVAAKLALKVGTDRFLKTIRTFGIGMKSGMGFPGEISGKIPPRKEWGPLTLANIGFGQGLLVTPIQMIRAYAAIFNGGWLVQPKLMVNPIDPAPSLQPNSRILSQKASSDIIEALKKVTQEGGTGMKAVLSGFQVAGKTGTAQLVDPQTGRYSREKYVASFIGAPVGVDPKIVIFTSLIEPRGVYYASETAAPLFKEVLGAVVRQLSLPIQIAAKKPVIERANVLANHSTLHPPSRSTHSVNPAQQDSISISQAAPVLLKNETGWSVPGLVGLTPREALKVLAGHHFQIIMTGAGVVSSQIPDAGKTIAEGETLRLLLSEP